jgi:hypothetical protein
MSPGKTARRVDCTRCLSIRKLDSMPAGWLGDAFPEMNHEERIQSVYVIIRHFCTHISGIVGTLEDLTRMAHMTENKKYFADSSPSAKITGCVRVSRFCQPLFPPRSSSTPNAEQSRRVTWESTIERAWGTNCGIS